jgi:hypothetical protein
MISAALGVPRAPRIRIFLSHAALAPSAACRCCLHPVWSDHRRERCDAQSRPRSQCRQRLDYGTRRPFGCREGVGGRHASHAWSDERRQHEGRGKRAHQSLSDPARARASSHRQSTHPGSGPHSCHTGRSRCVSHRASGVDGARTKLGSASRFITRDDGGAGAPAFRGQEAANDRARSKPSPQ